jgi:anti-sigma factor RsiW
MNVIISDSAGKAAFKGATKTDGAFATAALKPGNYVVQFSTTNAAVKGGQYSIVVASGKKKVVANAVAGDKFLTGGVAMKVEVGAGSSITGQVWAGATADASSQSKESMRKMQDRSQDSHQEGFHPSLSNTQDKMTNH